MKGGVKWEGGGSVINKKKKKRNEKSSGSGEKDVHRQEGPFQGMVKNMSARSRGKTRGGSKKEKVTCSELP